MLPLGSSFFSVKQPDPMFDDMTHYWPMDETSGTRYDTVGSWHITEQSGTVGNSPTSIRGKGALTVDSGAYLRLPDNYSVPTYFTMAGYFRYKSLSPVEYVSEYLTCFGGVSASTDGKSFTCQFLTPMFYDICSATVTTTNASDDGDWILWIARINNTGLAGKLRCYGLKDTNGQDANFSGGSWYLSLDVIGMNIGYGGAQARALELDEWMFWDRYITDDECATLGSGALP